MSDFYNSKFLYYKQYIYKLVIVIALTSIGYYLSDCMLFGRLECQTIIPRFFVLIPTIIFIIAYKKTENRVLISHLAYLVFHTVILGTICSCYFLPDLSFASDGFIILQFMFVAIGFTMPKRYSIIWQGISYIEYLIAQPFINFPDLLMMMTLGFPVYIGNCAISIAMDKTYQDQYESKKALEFSISHDPLTNCFNRNIFTDPKLGLIDDFKVNYKDYSFLLFDLDDFKNINDTYGHDTGDEVLKLVSDAVSGQITDTDYLVRWGGEEFLVVTKNSLENAIALGNAMNKATQAIDFNNLDITISIGVASGKSANYLETIKLADIAMYQAKHSGKNRTCC